MDEPAPGTLIYDLMMAEKHLSYALEILYRPGGEKRGFLYRRGLLKAQSLVMTRLTKEFQKKSN